MSSWRDVYAVSLESTVVQTGRSSASDATNHGGVGGTMGPPVRELVELLMEARVMQPACSCGPSHLQLVHACRLGASSVSWDSERGGGVPPVSGVVVVIKNSEEATLRTKTLLQRRSLT